MRETAERAYFLLSLALGRLLRSARYSKAQAVVENGERLVRKRRRFYAPLLVWLGGPLVRLLDTGVRVLPQRDWEERERRVYQTLGRRPIRIAADGSLLLPCLPGTTLASLLEDPALESSARTRAIELSVKALAELHGAGFTHGDAMAENVLVDLEGGVAHWFDFETVHDASRALTWRRTDDLRALVATSLLRTSPEKTAETLDLIVEIYADGEVASLLSASFTSVLRRSLAFHLGQAPLSPGHFRQIGRSLRGRSGGPAFARGRT